MNVTNTRRTVEGRCLRCDISLPKPSPKLCVECSAKTAAYRAAKKIEAENKGNCTKCFNRQASQDRKHCSICLSTRNETFPYAYRKRAEQRRKLNLCINCGKSEPLESLPVNAVQLFCEVCYLKRTAAHNLGSQKHWRVLKEKLESQNYKCAYTGKSLKLGLNASIDHKLPVAHYPLHKYDHDNVEWVDLKVNLVKRDLTSQEFIDLVETIVKHRHLTSPNSGMTPTKPVPIVCPMRAT